MTGIYDHPWMYELACGFRDVPSEVETLLRWYGERRDAARPRNVLELAAGPAEHAREFARRGTAATALDLNPAMCAYVRERAVAEVEVVEADMTAFDLGRRFDLAITMADSIAHLRTLDEFLAHLRCVARHLTDGGLYVLDMAHPADRLLDRRRSDSEWHYERDDAAATVRWGEPGDEIDPVTQIVQERVTVRVQRGMETTVIRDVVPYRFWTATELAAVIRLSGELTIEAQYGDFGDVRLESRDAWRMITILRPG